MTDSTNLTAADVTRWRVPFQTSEEARQYLSGETVACLVCGADRRILYRHLARAHHMTAREYRLRFGIPLSLALESPDITRQRSRAITPERLAAFRIVADAQRTQPRPRHAPPPPLAPPETPSFRFIGRQSIVDRPLQTMPEVEEYLSGPTITCLICGRRFQRLNRHLQSQHDITPDEYRAEFGVPYSRGLASAPSAAKSVAIMARPERLAQILELSRHAAENRPAHKPPRRGVPAVRAQWKKNSETGRYFAREYVTLPCTGCGKDVQTTRLGAAQTVTCLDCTTDDARKARLSYWRNKWAS